MSLVNAKKYATVYYPLNDLTNLGADGVGSNHLTNNNSVNVGPGIFGNAAHFKSANLESFTVADNAALDFSAESFTCRCWIKATTFNNYPVVFTKRHEGTGSNRYVLYYDTFANRLIWQVRLQSVTWPYPLSVDTWYYVVGIYDVSNNLLKISVDNGTLATASQTNGVDDSDGQFTVGASLPQSLYWDGLICDLVLLRGYILDTDEIAADWNNGIGIPFSQWDDTRIPNRSNNSGPCAPIPVPPDLQLVDWTNPINKDSVFAKGLKGFWLAGGPGWKTDRWYDISGGNNHGTLTNMVPSENWTILKSQNIVHFDSTSNPRVTVSESTYNFTNEDFSVSFWLRCDTLQIFRPIVLRGTYAVRGWYIDLYAPGGFYGIAITTNQSGTPQTTRSYDVTSTGILHHWVVTRSGGTCRIYRDGVEQGYQLTSAHVDPTSNTVTTLQIGGEGYSGDPVNMFIGDVLVHEKLLSPSEVSALYQESLQGYPTLLNHTSYFRAPAKRSFISVGYAPSEPTITDMDLVDWSDPINRDSVFAKGLKGFWLAGDKSWKTDRWYDISGNNNHGTLTNMVSSEDWVGDSPPGGLGSLHFDGSNDYIGFVNGSSILTGTGSFSVYVFANAETINSFRTVVGGARTDLSSAGSFYLQYRLDTGKWAFVVKNSSGTQFKCDGSTTSTGWHGLAGTFNSGTGEVQFWLDGRRDGTPTTLTGTRDVTADVYVGAGQFGGSVVDHWPGWIRSAFVFDRVLTENENAFLYQESLQGYPTLLKRYGPQPYTSSQVRRGVTVQVPEWEEEEPTLQNVDWSQPLNTDSVFAKGLKGFYLAGDQSWKTDRWYDLSGNGNHGVLTNMTPGEDWVGDSPKGGFGSLDFDGSNDYVVFNDDAIWTTTPLSIVLWFRQGVASDYIVLHKGDGSTNANSSLLIGRYTPVNSNLGFWTNTGSGWDFAHSSSAYNDGNWHFCVATHDGSHIRLYIDGTLVGGPTAITGGLNNDSNNLELARHPGVTGLAGNLACFCFYSRSFSESEVSKLYHESLKRYPTLLRRHTTQSYAVPAEVTSQITNYTLVVDSVTYSWTPQDTNLEYNRIFPADSVSYTWTPQAVTFAISILMSAESATYTWTPQNVNLEYNRNLVAESSSYTWTPQDTNLEYHYSVVADSATYTWTPQTANLEYHYNLVAESVGYIWTPQDSNLEYNRNLVAESATYTWSPQDVTLSVSGGTITMAADGVTYSWTPQDVNTEYHRLLSAESISYTWSPQDVTLSVTGAGVITMVADGVSYSWTPQVVNLEYHHNLIPDAPTYTWTPQATNLEQNRYLSAESVGYTWTPQDVQFQYHYNLPSESLSYTWTPQDTNLEYHRIFNTESVSYTWTPQAVSFGIGLILSAEPVSYSWSVQDTSLIYSRVLTAASATYTWTVQDVTFFAGVLVPPPIIEVTINFVHTQNSIINFQRTQNKTIDFGGGQ